VRSLCAPCGLPVGSLGLPVGSLWAPCGLPVGSLWAPCGLPVGSLWAPCGLPGTFSTLTRTYISLTLSLLTITLSLQLKLNPVNCKFIIFKVILLLLFIFSSPSSSTWSTVSILCSDTHNDVMNASNRTASQQHAELLLQEILVYL
jgi:hypothetical protein